MQVWISSSKDTRVDYHEDIHEIYQWLTDFRLDIIESPYQSHTLTVL